jgi:hypothetical protein
MAPSVVRYIAENYGDVGFCRRPPNPEAFDRLSSDVADRPFPDSLVEWFEWFGGELDEDSSFEGVHGFLPLTADFSYHVRSWKHVSRATSFLSEALVPIMMNDVGTTVSAFLPLASMGPCSDFPMVFVTRKNSMLTTSFGHGFDGIVSLFKRPESFELLLPAQFD